MDNSRGWLVGITQEDSSWPGTRTQSVNPPLAITRILYGCQLVPMLLHLPHSYLFVVLENNGGWPKVLGSCTHEGDLEETSDSGLAQFQLLCHLGSRSKTAEVRSSSLSRLLFVNLPFQQI